MGATAIGLDIYRDLPVPPGTEDLERALVELRNVIVVRLERAGGRRSIRAPAVLQDSEQVGVNDIVLDADETVRRGLLFLDDGERVFSSFALRLALIHLEARGVGPESDPDSPGVLRLGAAVLPPLEPRDGGYVDVDAGGYHICSTTGARRAPSRA